MTRPAPHRRRPPQAAAGRAASPPPASRLGRVFRAESTRLLPAARHHALPRRLRPRHGALVVVGRVAPRATAASSCRPPGRACSPLVGIPLMLIASRMPERVLEALAPGRRSSSACALQLLVVATPLGYGRRQPNWLAIGPVQFQPSELIKVALVIWLGCIAHDEAGAARRLRHAASCPILLVGGGAIGLVLVGNDLGTVMIMGAIALGALFFAGVRLRLLLPSRARRRGRAVRDRRGRRATAACAASARSCNGELHRQFDNDDCWQIQHGTCALANGGIFGVGLGNSTAKWSWLPAADNDFIFAIIGEELGLIGAVVVLGLFVVLAIAFVRVMRSARTTRSRRRSRRRVMVWIIGQACRQHRRRARSLPRARRAAAARLCGRHRSAHHALRDRRRAVGRARPRGGHRAAARADARAAARAAGRPAR